MNEEAAPEVLAEAKADGWSDKDHWRGPPDLWVDANEFVRRKHTVLPLLRKANEKVNADLALTRAELESLRGNMDDFVKYQHEQTVAKLAEQRKELLAAKRTADEAGDDAAVIRLEEQLDENAEARVAAKVAKVAPAKPAEVDPQLKTWHAANSWFGTDDVKTGLAMGLGREAVRKGLSGPAYFEHIDAGMKKVFARDPEPDKGEPGGPAGLKRGGTGKYASLPADAKAQCDADAKRFVGANKMFKTAEAWQANFCKQYFQE